MASASVGLSFGTESLVVAVTNTSGNPQVYANADGDRVTPTYVSFIDGELLHGNAARAAYVRQPVQSVPYLLPLLSTDIVNNNSLQTKCEVEVRADPASGSDRVVIPSADVEGVLPAVLPKAEGEETTLPHYTSELIASFLGDVKTKTIDGPCSGRNIGCLCVSVPRYMEQAVVRSAIEGANIAKEVRVIYDDVAAVIAHNIGNSGFAPKSTAMDADRKDILVLDWGANVLAASILRLEGGVFRLLGHNHLFGAGAIALDKQLAANCCSAFQRKTKLDAASNGKSIRKLLFALEGVRKTLTMSTLCPISVEAFCDGMDFKDNLSRVKLDMAIRDSGLPEKLNTVLKNLVDSVADGEGVDVKHVIYSGGLCRIQYIQATAKAAIQALIPGAADAEIYDSIPTDEVSALGACAEAHLTTATHVALTTPAAEVPNSDKYRAVDASVKDVDNIDVECVDAGIALYIGANAFTKAATVVPGAKVSEVLGTADIIASPTSTAALKDFAKNATEKGAYELPNAQLHVLASRGAPLPLSSAVIEAAAGAAVLPVAVIAANETHSYVVPLLKKAHKLANESFKVLVTSEKNGVVAAVSVIEIEKDGSNTVGVRAEW